MPEISIPAKKKNSCSVALRGAFKAKYGTETKQEESYHREGTAGSVQGNTGDSGATARFHVHESRRALMTASPQLDIYDAG